ncbi:hypothetical protein [Streptomyces pactum]|uniref:Uncharacterized protein n=1 Tax=Streptomyces pactum TaxID=68249 RepID=A0A1S6JGL6_9ACTN|nr:hypothetical protein [Streptomyces pactum]AQS70872.1 hypothetical protein B1H29_31830 [Streptomyces pactum]
MRSNRTTTSQTTCDDENCTNYAITAAYQTTTPADQAARHNAALAVDGWADIEGRDYCPEHNPAQGA